VTEAVAGLRPLLRVTLRQDARKIAPWIVLISALSVTSVLAYAWVFPDAASRTELATTVAANPAFSLIFGPGRDLSTADGFNAWRAGALGGFFAALMAIHVVVRNTRAHEDSGQAELIASGVIGRTTRLAVAVVAAWLASAVLGVVAAVVTILFGGGVANSITLAATFTASGLMFAGVAAVAAQIGSEARTATSIAVTALGIAFIARGYIDASEAPGWTIWLTPLGWTQEVRPASGNTWWPLLACLAFVALGIGVAAVLQGRRDFGMGMSAPRPGPARGGAVTSAWGLAVRLNRGAIVSWTLAFVVLGAVFGFLATTVGDLFAQNPGIARIIAAGGATRAGLIFEFLVTILKLVGIIASVYGVQVVMRIYAEETEHRVEPLLAGALRRARYLASNAVLAFAGPAFAVLVGGAVIALTASSRDPSIDAGDVVLQACATIPAVWVLVALALAAVGAEPSRRLVAWFAVVASFALTILGPLFELWDWILGLSPFWHVPNVTADQPDLSGLGWLLLVAAALTAAGFAGFRRRDVL
jgi:ABC-2 type transport system permease protein